MGKTKNLLNGMLLCDKGQVETNQSDSGFETPKESRFKMLTVKESSEEDIKVGDKVVVPIHSGQELGLNTDFLVIKRSEIIYFE